MYYHYEFIFLVIFVAYITKVVVYLISSCSSQPFLLWKKYLIWHQRKNSFLSFLRIIIIITIATGPFNCNRVTWTLENLEIQGIIFSSGKSWKMFGLKIAELIVLGNLERTLTPKCMKKNCTKNYVQKYKHQYYKAR